MLLTVRSRGQLTIARSPGPVQSTPLNCMGVLEDANGTLSCKITWDSYYNVKMIHKRDPIRCINDCVN